MPALVQSDPLEAGESWCQELLGGLPGQLATARQPPRVLRLEGSSRFPRVIEGHSPCSLRELILRELGELPIADVRVNLPAWWSARPGRRHDPAVDYLRMLWELRQRRAA
jgi:hypothetical protein